MTQPAHKPYIRDDQTIPELGFIPILVGAALGIVFGAASVYLALKIGMTISASIPVAVMSISIFRWLSRGFKFRPATILENNIVQTTGSAGESIAFGVAVTMPALLILGHDMDLSNIMTVAILGSTLGVLMMIPLRRGLIVKEHGKLKYPEGTACAEVLIAGEKGGTNAKTVFTGFALGLLYKFIGGEGGLRLLKNTPERILTWFKGGSVAMETSPELMGVGYIIGPRTAGIMCAGGVLAYLVLIPAIKIFGEGIPNALFPATKLIKDMSPHEIRSAYVLYIGAGAVAAGGILSLIKVIPTIISAFVHGFTDLLAGFKGKERKSVARTEMDLPMVLVVLGSLGLVALLMTLPSLHVSFIGACLIVVFGFIFVTVSSRLTGEIGSTSNPISGMTVATLLLTCLLFLLLGKTSPVDRLTALSIAAIVCIASSNGGTTSQDLKTGYLVGGTPRSQQIGILIGSLTSALVIGLTLKLFNDSSTIFAPREEVAYTVSADRFQGKQKLFGPDADKDPNEYNVVFFTDETVPRDVTGKAIVQPGKYFVDDSGKIKYLVDPGINGVLDPKEYGHEFKKFDAPKARLMSLIIDGILTRKLPWGLVLLGVFIALTLELSGIASLPFAVGVYLPLSASTPIWVGGMVRWLVDKKSKMTEAESDSSPGVLLSSGLIAGGAIGGMTLAIIMGASEKFSEAMNLPEVTHSKALQWLANNDILSLAGFAALGYFVYKVGRSQLLVGKKSKA